MQGDNPAKRPMTAKRQKILDKALAQLRKSRGEMDPKILNKIRRIIAGSPDIMKSLGVTDELKPKEKASKAAAKPKAQPKPTVKKKQASGEGYEAVDQAKNMEVMAKLMALNPNNKEMIKSAIKKAED